MPPRKPKAEKKPIKVQEEVQEEVEEVQEEVQENVQEDVQEDVQEEVQEEVVKKVKKNIIKKHNKTVSDVNDVLDIIVSFTDDTIEKFENKNKPVPINAVKNIRRKLIEFQKIFKRICLKQKRKSTGKGGFQNPVSITNDLADFLKIKHGDLIPRTLVTRLVCRYIHPYKIDNEYNAILDEHGEKQFTNERNLQDGNTIKPDEPLTKLLDFTPGMTIVTRNGIQKELNSLTYATMQILLSKHFIKVIKAPIVKAPIEEEPIVVEEPAVVETVVVKSIKPKKRTKKN